jgi:hypothetical protein
MALSSATLKAEILKVIDKDNPSWTGYPASPAAAAAKWKTAYDVYGSAAANSGGAAVLSKLPASFESILAAQLPAGNPGGTAAAAATAFANAWVAYWTGATFGLTPVPTHGSPCPNVGGNTTFGLVATSVVSVIVPAPLIASLTSAFGVLTGTVDAKATALANAFHAATTANITVLTSGTDTTPPTAGPLPITNTCQVF